MTFNRFQNAVEIKGDAPPEVVVMGTGKDYDAVRAILRHKLSPVIVITDATSQYQQERVRKDLRKMLESIKPINFQEPNNREVRRRNSKHKKRWMNR